MIVNGGDDGDVSRLPSPPFGICVSYDLHLPGHAELQNLLTGRAGPPRHPRP